VELQYFTDVLLQYWCS